LVGTCEIWHTNQRVIMENKEDILAQLRNLVWEPGKFAAPLKSLIGLTEDFVQRQYLDWYKSKRRAFGRAGRGFRVAAICLTAVGGLFPLVIEIFHKSAARHQLAEWQQFAVTNGVVTLTNLPAGLAGIRPTRCDWLLDPTWAAVLLAIAATLVLLDRFFGSTSGWVRFSLAAQQLENALTEFRFAMQAERLSWNSVEPSVAQAQAAMAKVEAFVRQVGAVVLEETKTWADEFSTMLKELDQREKAAAEAQDKATAEAKQKAEAEAKQRAETEAKEKAAAAAKANAALAAKPPTRLQITVTNGDQCPKGWKLGVDDQPATDRTGKEAQAEVTPGTHVVRVTGELNGKPAKDEKKDVTVAAGQTVKVELTLV
jgi:hypothetical protein